MDGSTFILFFAIEPMFIEQDLRTLLVLTQVAQW